jgi:hypothetical protein
VALATGRVDDPVVVMRATLPVPDDTFAGPILMRPSFFTSICTSSPGWRRS